MVKTLVMKHCIPMTKVLSPVLLSRVFGLDIFIQTKRVHQPRQMSRLDTGTICPAKM